MALKFNNGDVVLCCDLCSVIIMKDFSDYDYRAICNLENKNERWFCKNCDPHSQKKQNEMFIDEVNKISLEYSNSRRNKLIKKYGVFSNE